MLLVFFPSLVFSQAAVHLNCVSSLGNGSVVLRWNVPSNPCPVGCFVDYKIYSSKNRAPFVLVGTVNNSTKTIDTIIGVNPTFPHDSFLYFIETECNCGGGSIYSYSDTANLNVNTPDVPIINFVTVNGNLILMNWSPSASAQTFAYIIYYYDATQNKYLKIDTVFGYKTDSDLISGYNPNTQSAAFSIAALDSCGSLGPFSMLPQYTVFLQIVQNRCNHSITLNWNDYKNWQKGVKQYEIYENINGAGFAKVQTLNATTLSYTFNSVHDGDSLCFFVKARENILNDTSISNEVCIKINVVQPPAYTMYQNASVFQNNSVQIIFVPDVTADLESFNILRSTTNSNYSFIQSVNSAKPLLSPITTNDATALVHQKPMYYFIESVDSCGKVFSGTHCNTIFLSGDINGSNSTTLKWNPFHVDSAIVHSYDILRSNNGGQSFVQIGNVDSATFTFNDNLQQFATSPDSFCYRIQAHFSFANKLFVPSNNISLSNDWCAHCYSEFFAPNTIFPKGKNNLFKPIITFPDIENYQMIIFNRYGEKIFISNDYNTGWNGTFNGTEVPQGNYTYLITFQKPDGKKFVQQGNVVVIY